MTLQTLIKYFFAILIIIFTIWNRFLRERGNTIVSVIPLFIIIILKICLIIFFAILLYINSKTILRIQRKSKYIENILLKDYHIKTSWEELSKMTVVSETLFGQIINTFTKLSPYFWFFL